MLVITKNTSAQWRLGNWCLRQRLDARPRTYDQALAQDEPFGWSVLADPGLAALARGIQEFSKRTTDAERLRLVFVGAGRLSDDETELRHLLELHDLVWLTRVAWPSRSGELRAILEQRTVSTTRAFVARAAHEMVTPLATVSGWCELLEQSAPETRAERTLQALPVLRRSVAQLERLVTDLRDAEEPDRHSFALHLDDVDVNSIAAMATNGLLPLANNKGILLGPIISPHAPRVRGDETRLLQVLHNLLANSVKFTARGGRIDVSVSEHSGTVIIAVRDTGKGVSAAALPHLFTRAEHNAPRRSGLGLMIAREIVERHHGEIRAHSDGENQGTLMLVSLPALAPKP